MPEEHGPSIESLIERWVCGDKAAAEEIYRRYYRRVWLFAVKITGQENDADDIAQQALAAGLEGIKGGKRPDKFTGWIMGIAHHAANKKWRKDRREHGTEIEERILSATSGPGTRLIREEMDGLMERLLGKLAPKDRELLRLRVEQKIARNEAAARMGLGATALDRHMEHALSFLREELSRHFTTLILPRAFEKRPVTMVAVARLRPLYREAFTLRHLEGLPIKEVAARLGVPAPTVEARLKHAYQQLGCDPDDDFSALGKQ